MQTWLSRIFRHSRADLMLVVSAAIPWPGHTAKELVYCLQDKELNPVCNILTGGVIVTLPCSHTIIRSY